jgi:adenosylhomocysteine nucleosidase
VYDARVPVAILAPMAPELRPLVRPLGLRRDRGADLWSGRLGRTDVLATITGIGTAPAARAAERILDAAPISYLVVVGVAGGIGPSVAIGDLVVPERVVDLETGAEATPSRLGPVAPRGALFTSGELQTDPALIARLEREGAVAIDMETAAIAAVCARRGCAWSVFRAISDRADDGTTDPAMLTLGGPDGSGDLRAVAGFVLRQPWRIPELARLARGLRVATARAAEATLDAIATLQP